MRTHELVMLGAILTAGVFAPTAVSQPTAIETGETTITGIVSSSSPNTLVVRAVSGLYQLFVFDRYTVKPTTLTVGAQVTVISAETGEPGVRLARSVSVTTATSAPKPGEAGQTTAAEAPVPAAVRDIERSIERQTKKYGAGFRIGAGLDPEVLLIGVHARMGPIFDQNLSFRPNLEYGWGEVTKLFALNPEVVYRLPLTPRTGKYAPYVGAGPSFVFKHQNFENEDVDFGDFEFEAGLNIFTGVQLRNGFFMEVKATVYSSPHLRFLLGYSF